MSNEEIKGADTFAQVVERYRTMWADWELVDTPGDHPTHAILRKGLVQVNLNLQTRKMPVLSCTIDIPNLSGTRTTIGGKVIPMDRSVTDITAKVFGLVAEKIAKANDEIAALTELVMNYRVETETLHQVWHMLGGTKPTYTYFHRTGSRNDEASIGISATGRNRFDLDAHNLTNRQVLEIAKILCQDEAALTFPHPSETLKVDELGIIYCVDTMVGADLEIGTKRIYKVVWKLEDDEWDAVANVDDEDIVILSKCGSTFPGDEDFAAAAANLERKLDIRIGAQ